MEKTIREDPPATLPRFDPLSPNSYEVSGDAKLKVRLKFIKQITTLNCRYAG